MSEQRQKRVWIINHNAIPPGLGGLNRHYYFSKYLCQKGYSVTILTASKVHNSKVNMIEDRALSKEVNWHGVPYTFIRTGEYEGNGLRRVWNLIEFYTRVQRVCKSLESPDVIYASSPDLFGAIAGLRTAKRLQVPCIFEVRDLWPESIVAYQGISKKNMIIRVLYWLEKWAYTQADRILFTIDNGEEYLADRGMLARFTYKVAHINNGVDIEEFEENAQAWVLPDAHLDDASAFNAVYTGSVRKVNDVGTLVDAARALQEMGSDANILVWGGGETEPLRDRIEKEGLHNLVIKGAVDKKYIPGILRRADVCLLHWKDTELMRYGTSANKIFDYLAAGRPVLSSIFGIRQIIEDTGCGIQLSSQSPEEIATGIIRMQNLDADAYKRYCENAVLAASKYDYAVLGEKLIQLIEGLDKS